MPMAAERFSRSAREMAMSSAPAITCDEMTAMFREMGKRERK